MNYTDTTPILTYIMSLKEQFKGPHITISKYILRNPQETIGLTAKELAKNTKVSEASVVRFCQSIGFKGFGEFKIKLARDIGSDTSTAIPEGIKRNDSAWNVVNKVMQIEYQDIQFALDMLDQTIVTKALKYIQNAEKIAFFGIGSSSLVALSGKEHFLHYGKTALNEIDSLSQIVLANTLTKNDIAFAISLSGETLVPIEAVHVASHNGAKTICLTQNSSSTLAKACNLCIAARRKSNSLDDLGATTRIVHTALIDALSIAYASQNWDRVSAIAKDNKHNFGKHVYGD